MNIYVYKYRNLRYIIIKISMYYICIIICVNKFKLILYLSSDSNDEMSDSKLKYVL